MRRYPPFALIVIAALTALPGAGRAATPNAKCEAAWETYNELKARSLMEEAQYPLTQEGAGVRSACGKEALPVPPGADINPVRPRVRPPGSFGPGQTVNGQRLGNR